MPILLKNTTKQTHNSFLILVNWLSHLGHLDSNVRSDHVTECVSKFLLCSDNQSSEGLMKTNRNCYRDFQSCSGSNIEIAEGITYLIYQRKI